MNTVKYVIDYAAKGEQTAPRMLHRTDCWHSYGSTPYRLATKQELATLPSCYHCARKDAGEAR
jgi:hypothetical protein